MFQICNTKHFVLHEIENFLPKESGLSTLPFRALKLHKYNVLLEHRKHCEIHKSVPECLCECVCVERCCCGRKRSRICIAKFRSQSGVGWAPPHIHVENSRTRIRVECTQISYTHTHTHTHVQTDVSVRLSVTQLLTDTRELYYSQQNVTLQGTSREICAFLVK